MQWTCQLVVKTGTPPWGGSWWSFSKGSKFVSGQLLFSDTATRAVLGFLFVFLCGIVSKYHGTMVSIWATLPINVDKSWNIIYTSIHTYIHYRHSLLFWHLSKCRWNVKNQHKRDFVVTKREFPFTLDSYLEFIQSTRTFMVCPSLFLQADTYVCKYSLLPCKQIVLNYVCILSCVYSLVV